jgi:hypothetical protein
MPGTKPRPAGAAVLLEAAVPEADLDRMSSRPN